jgi:hypothetical protein
MRGSYNLGAANPRALLTEHEVLEIHEMARERRWTQAKIGELFGVTRECVSSIARKVRWKHLFEVNERRTDMPQEVKYRGPTEAERIAARLRNSGDAKHADTVDQRGSSPLRHFTNVHHSYNRTYAEGEEQGEKEHE